MANITQLSQLDLTASYSYADYLTWRLTEAVELIKGKIQFMSLAPNVKHQRISISLSSHLFFYFENKDCQVFDAPFDVRLYDRNKLLLANQDITTVVQPDICVICDKEKLDEQGCNGAPVYSSYAGDDVAAPYLFPDLAIDLPTLFKDV